MNHLRRKQSIISGIIFAMLLVACQANPPATVTPNAASLLSLWGKKNSSANVKARLGNGEPYAMAISPNGETIAVVGVSGITTYDFKTLEKLWRSPLVFLKRLPQMGVQVAWSPDGSQIATTSNGDAVLWNAKTGELLNKLPDSQRFAASLQWSPDGQVLAAAVQGLPLRLLLWDKTGKQIDFPESENMTSFLGWMPEGETIRISKDGEIISWDIRTGKQSYSPLVKASYPFGWQSPDGTRSIASEKPGEMTLWDTQSGRQLPIMYKIPDRDTAHLVKWSPNNRLIAAAGFGYGKVLIFDIDTEKPLHLLERKQSGNVEEIVSLAWSPDSKNLITTSSYTTITVWNAQTGQELRSLDDHVSSALSLAWSPDGNILASGSEDGEVILWDAITNKKLRSFHDPSGWVSSLAWAPDGKRLAAAGSKRITIWEAETGDELKVFSGLEIGVNKIGWSPDGKSLASTSGDYQGIIWDGVSYEKLLSLKDERLISPSKPVWSPQGDLLATDYWSSSDFTNGIAIWNPQTGEQIRLKSGSTSFAWRPASEIIASIHDKTTLLLWNAKTGDDISQFDMGFEIFHLDWSPDGKLLLVADLNTLSIVDAQTGENLHQLDGNVYSISQARWSPRGDLVATTSEDGMIIIWEVKTPEKQP